MAIIITLTVVIQNKIENKLKEHDYCYIEMTENGNNISKYNHSEKSMKVPLIIYADIVFT